MNRTLIVVASLMLLVSAPSMAHAGSDATHDDTQQASDPERSERGPVPWAWSFTNVTFFGNDYQPTFNQNGTDESTGRVCQLVYVSTGPLDVALDPILNIVEIDPEGCLVTWVESLLGWSRWVYDAVPIL